LPPLPIYLYPYTDQNASIRSVLRHHKIISSHPPPTPSSSAASADCPGKAHSCPAPTYSPLSPYSHRSRTSAYRPGLDNLVPRVVAVWVVVVFDGGRSAVDALRRIDIRVGGGVGAVGKFVSEGGHGCYCCCRERQDRTGRIEIGQSIETWAPCEKHLDHGCRIVSKRVDIIAIFSLE